MAWEQSLEALPFRGGSNHDTEAIDLAVIKVFAGFAVDYQEYFKADL